MRNGVKRAYVLPIYFTIYAWLKVNVKIESKFEIADRKKTPFRILTRENIQTNLGSSNDCFIL
jgi:hypothetical protein